MVAIDTAVEKDSKKKITFIVNLKQHSDTKGDVTFEEIVHLAYPELVITPETYMTLTYRRGQGNKPEGSLIAGESVKLKEGMIFNVQLTVQS